ncbi:MAG: long-chain fatty acid--CoA ligase [Bacteroidetes bacterium]|nr:MAG: long-chain fatty acid--CoA ligase [Bacteroidota bacterium]
MDQRGIYRYEDLINHSARFASALLKIKPDWKDQPVAFLVHANFDYVACLWGIWRAGAIAVPIAVTHPKAEIQHILENTGTEVLIIHEDFEPKVKDLIAKPNIILLKVQDMYSEYIADVPKVDEDRAALILYTSGTTSKPKGAIHTHKSIKAQVKILIEAWEWTSKDVILNVLPLHHVHGVINVLSCCLWAGATCEMLTKFDPEVVCTYMIYDNPTIFMAVPTIYHKLIDFWEKCPLEEQLQISKACARMRLMISGSAALPATILEKWYKISHHILLERYGMTEVGMILSNSLHGKRHIGLVGKTLPHVFVRLVDEQQNVITEINTQGEIQVKSAGVFAGYWKDEEFTKNAFQDGWFKTGDIAIQNEHGDFKIIGRHNIDIIKTGGHKVSALEVEDVLLSNLAIDECAVVGLDDEEWGQKIAVAFVLEEGQTFDEIAIKEWAKDKLTNYKIPSVWLMVENLPHNAMNKVVKSKVKELFAVKA